MISDNSDVYEAAYIELLRSELSHGDRNRSDLGMINVKSPAAQLWMRVRDDPAKPELRRQSKPF